MEDSHSSVHPSHTFRISTVCRIGSSSSWCCGCSVVAQWLTLPRTGRATVLGAEKVRVSQPVRLRARVRHRPEAQHSVAAIQILSHPLPIT